MLALCLMLSMTQNCAGIIGGSLATEYLVHLNKLDWYLLLTKGTVYITALWKNENEAAVSLLGTFYDTTLCNYMCTCMRTVSKCLVKSKLALASCVYIATCSIAKQSLDKFNSAQCVHELL